ncbi:hypothetical protein C4D60_Mb10t22630 [Musa balbisiana]|uniref:RING-type domain-containing protein n=1 Tax=Musa balbisiana TaxID=52838 RepID=A0A4S8IZY5_MUSBA|nr:hypothetical protein C4D60_Mb10t22630 [Musa balbisiana]
MEGRGLRRSLTLPEQQAVVVSCNLGDLLKVQDEDEVRPSSAVAACAKRGASSASGGGGGGRTLLDIMREEPGPNAVVVGRSSGNGIKWKSFKDRLHLRLRRAGAAWAVSCSQFNPMSYPELFVSVHTNPGFSRPVSRSTSIRNSELPVPASISGTENNPAATDAAASTAVAAPSPPEEHPSGAAGNGESSDHGSTATAAEEEPVRVSLMALLEQTDRQWSSAGEGSSPAAALAALSEEEPAAAEDVGGGILHVCCVCMVRHKGAAFIPCGHTFCRLCSRELWVNRGSCPLCNGNILEILDIF